MPEEKPDIAAEPEKIEEAAAHDAEVTLGDAHVQITDDPGAAPPVQPSTVHAAVQDEDVPKGEMHIPQPLENDIFDCTIVGGGPTGLFAAFYAGMREMSVKIVDSLAELGGQVTALYPEKLIFDVAGFPQILGKDLIAACVEQGLQFGPTVCLGEKVEHLERHDDGTFTLRTNRGEHRTRTIIIAAGVGAFAPRKLPNLAELDALEGKSVFYFVKSLETFRDKNLLIVGGGDSALDWALNLEPIAEKITLIHRRDKWRAHEDSVRKLMASSVDVRVFHEVKSVQADADGNLSGVAIYQNKTQEETTLKVDALILNLGFIANIGTLREWGLEIVDGGIAIDPGTTATSIPGIFAAGDIARFKGKLNLIATGFGEAATAANYCKNFIDPTSKAFPGHSSEKSDEVKAAH